MSETITIAIDCMGGDQGVKATIPGAARALSQNPNLRFILFGRERDVTAQLSRYADLRAVSTVVHTDQVIAADEKPSIALRQGRESSMRRAIDAVASGQASCVVSSGNTGALMATAKMVLKCLPGIHRPAIAGVFQTTRGQTIVLDLGANLVADTEMLVQFAILGTVYARAVKGIDRPTVGILNIGSEEMKGHDELREAAAILNNIKFPGCFHGFIEGNDVPFGVTDVVVTDGFTGNVALKVAEGVAKMTSTLTKQALRSSFLGMIGALLASGSLKRLRARVDPRAYNGGMFLGLNGVCVKSHGGSDQIGFANAVMVAAGLVQNKFNDKVAAEIRQVMDQESFTTAAIGDVA